MGDGLNTGRPAVRPGAPGALPAAKGGHGACRS